MEKEKKEVMLNVILKYVIYHYRYIQVLAFIMKYFRQKYTEINVMNNFHTIEFKNKIV